MSNKTKINPNDVLNKFKEFLKCKRDPIYFIENYVLLDFGGQKIPMKLRPKQKEIIETLIKDKYEILFGSRQVGKTMVILAYILWLILFHDNYTAFIVQMNKDYAASHLSDLKKLYDGVPDWLKYKPVQNSALRFVLENNSRVVATWPVHGKEEKVGRGLRGGFIFIDEAAFIDELASFMKGLIPTTTFIFEKYKDLSVPYGIVIASTAGEKYQKTGQLNEFYRMWKEATLNPEKSLYKPIIYHWKDVPEFRNNPNFKEEQLKKLGGDLKRYRQEYELVFSGSSNSFLPEDIIEILQSNEKDPVSYLRLPYSELFIYDENIEQHKKEIGQIYILGIDIASKYSGDYSAMVVFDLWKQKVVADYKSILEISKFQKDIISVLEFFNYKILLAVEKSPISEQLLEYLTSIPEIRRLIFKDPHKQDRYGLIVSAKSRPLLIDSLYTFVVNKPKNIISKRLSEELITLERNPRTGRVEAPGSLHDDLSFAFGWVTFSLNYVPIESYIQKVLTKSQNRLKEAVSLIKSLKSNNSYNNYNYNNNNIDITNINAINNNPDIQLPNTLTVSDVDTPYIVKDVINQNNKSKNLIRKNDLNIPNYVKKLLFS